MTDHIVILIIFLSNYGFFSTHFINVITGQFSAKLLSMTTENSYLNIYKEDRI